MVAVPRRITNPRHGAKALSTGDILDLAFGVPFCACLGLGLGLLVCAMFGVDLTEVFRRPSEEE